MKCIFTIFLISILSFLCFIANASGKPMSPEEMKTLMKSAVTYAVENNDPNMDYSKYVSKDYIQHIDGETFNYVEWAQHMQDIKKLMKSQKVDFQDVLADGDKVVINQVVHGIKKDGTEIAVKVIGIFKIKDGKIVYGDELTRLIQGSSKDKNIGSLK